MDEKIVAEHGLSKEEFNKIKTILGREPNIVELGMYSVLWSEHCSYKSSKIYLKQFPTKGPHILQGPGENAGIIDIGDGYAITMKIESHNHPSQVEPFQGAATGVGGIVRDVFTMGARPIASLNSLRFGPLSEPHNRYLFDGVVAGISSYGNCLGLPTVAGEVYFDPSYSGNCLVNAMCVGIVKIQNKSKTQNPNEESEIPDVIVKAKAEGIGNPVLYVGSSTGRDGIHGATFASVELNEDSTERRSNVQVGDPFTEKLLIEACLELLKTGNVIGMQDMGAAGMTSSTSEMSSRGGCGMEIDISRVPQREEAMTPYEIMLSESQERMVVVMKKGTEDDAFRIFKKWGLNAVVMGKVTDDGSLTIKVKDKVVAQVPARSLADDAPVYERPVEQILNPLRLRSGQAKSEIRNKSKIINSKSGYNKHLLSLLSDPNIASKAWVYEQYDHMVQTNTSVLPGKGDAAVLRIKGTDKMIALTTDGNGRYCYFDPYKGGMIAVAEAARNLVCVGAKPMAVTDCLNFGNPEKPQIMQQFKLCVKGLADACRAFETPVVSGNVSFYNETDKAAIYPTPVIGMLGRIDKNACCDMAFRDNGDIIVLLGVNKEEQGECPDIDIELEKSVQKTAYEAIKIGAVKSAHDTSEGGLAAALSECCIEGGRGAVVTFDEKIDNGSLLFDETQSRIILTIDPSQIFVLNDIAMLNKTPVDIIGKVSGKSLKISNGKKKLIDMPVNRLSTAYKSAISDIMGA
ncbi:MAG: phosphoribosylformylglycinamidine synthase subunit PurL [Candidatus Saganbacteria bacterium]|nr:phosphoribosylformylglycinamidine synthase subunit PurL [Candidatus Saganbacteria bacterium]